MKKYFWPRLLTWATPLALIALLFVLTQCGKDGPAPGTFGSVYAVMSQSCIQCHAPGKPATAAGAKLDVSTQVLAYKTLVTDANVASGNDQSVRRALMPLARLVAKRDCAGWMVRHLNKSAGKQAVYRGGGAVGLLGACRSAWLIGRDPTVEDVLIHRAGQRK